MFRCTVQKNLTQSQAIQWLLNIPLAGHNGHAGGRHMREIWPQVKPEAIVAASVTSGLSEANLIHAILGQRNCSKKK